MKVLPWVLIGVSVGFLAYLALNQPGPQYATGSDDVEDAADRTSLWGSKQRVSGSGHSVLGRVKRSVGEAIGNDDLTAEGAGQQIFGAAKDAVGETAQAVGKTIHDLNR